MSYEDTSVRRVVALSYQPGDGVPRLVCKAVGAQAEEVLRENRNRYQKRVVKNEALLRRLYQLPLQGEIGLDLYEVVALLLVHVFEVEANIYGAREHE